MRHVRFLAPRQSPTGTLIYAFDCRCGHRIGDMVRTVSPDGGKGYHSRLPSLIRLPDSQDGTPRYGLRAGAHRRGRDPIRRDWRDQVMKDGRVVAFPVDSNETSIEPRYLAKCVNCGSFSVVDAANLPAMMDATT